MNRMEEIAFTIVTFLAAFIFATVAIGLVALLVRLTLW